MLMLPNQVDYVRAFCGCLDAGLIAVPLFPPAPHRQSYLDRVRNMVADAQPALMLGEADNLAPLRAMLCAYLSSWMEDTPPRPATCCDLVRAGPP